MHFEFWVQYRGPVLSMAYSSIVDSASLVQVVSSFVWLMSSDELCLRSDV